MADEGAGAFPLAAALLDLPGAHPDSAVLCQILQSNSTDPAMCKLWSCTSREGQEWALRNAPKVTASLPVPPLGASKVPDQVLQNWRARLVALRPVLGTRDGHRQETCLKLVWERTDGAGLAQFLALVPEELQETGACITGVRLSGSGRPDRVDSHIMGFLSSAATVFTNLRALDICGAYPVLPDPSLLPGLAQLSVNVSWPFTEHDESYKPAHLSIGRYVPQLASLHLRPPRTRNPWRLCYILRPSSKLTDFSYYEQVPLVALDNRVYDRVTDRAVYPGLRSIAVSSMRLNRVNTPWPGWEVLGVDKAELRDLAEGLPAPSGPVTVRIGLLSLWSTEMIPADGVQPWLDRVQWEFSDQGCHGRPCVKIHAIKEEDVLVQLAALRSMKFTEADMVSLRFSEVPITHVIMQALRGLPAGKFIDLSRSQWPLPAEAYCQLAYCVPSSYQVWDFGTILTSRSEVYGCIVAGISERCIAESLPARQINLW